MGCGRSGTSLVGGLVASAGYFSGHDLWPARDANPVGFYEDATVNRINEDLLAPLVPDRIPRLGRYVQRWRPVYEHRWLVSDPVRGVPEASPELAQEIRHLTEHPDPWCYKDPRFSYTLPAWRPFVADAAFVCVFRQPGATAQSIVREVASEPIYSYLRIDEDRALTIWLHNYRSVLDRQRTSGDWLFVHYDDILDGDGVERLGQHLGTSISRDLIDRSLRRSQPAGGLPKAAEDCYRELCELAEHAP